MVIIFGEWPFSKYDYYFSESIEAFSPNESCRSPFATPKPKSDRGVLSYVLRLLVPIVSTIALIKYNEIFRFIKSISVSGLIYVSAFIPICNVNKNYWKIMDAEKCTPCVDWLRCRGVRCVSPIMIISDDFDKNDDLMA